MFSGALLVWWALGGANPIQAGQTAGGSGFSPGSGSAGGGSSGSSGGGSW